MNWDKIERLYLGRQSQARENKNEQKLRLAKEEDKILDPDQGKNEKYASDTTVISIW